jgi:hypothetical protein
LYRLHVCILLLLAGFFVVSLAGFRIRTYLFDTDLDPEHFRLNTDPDPDPELFEKKLEKNLQLEKLNFFISKTTIYLSLGLRTSKLQNKPLKT